MADAAVKWTDKLKGAFVLTFLFGHGIKPFEADPSKGAALRSLWIQALLLPASIASAYVWPPKDLVEQPMQTVQSIVVLSYVVGFFAGLALFYLAAVVFDRKERFWLTFSASNWTALTQSLVSLPFLFAAIYGWYPRPDMDNVFMMLTYYGVLVSGCVAYRGLKIDWEWAGFLVCMGIFVSQQIWNLLFWLHGVPINWAGM
jgi:hypothetical protein